jgi:hypothetical protein
MPCIVDTTKPLIAMRTLASQLGWNGLQLWRHDFPDRDPAYWYQTTDIKFMLWISEYPIGQDEVYYAVVYADRYGICSGLHEFALSDPDAVSQLMPWTKRQLFRNPAWRRELRRRYPEFCIVDPTPRRCTAERVFGKWEPYEAWEEKPDPLKLDGWY